KAIEALLLEFKQKQFVNRPLHVILEQIYENKAETYPAEEIHTTARENVGPSVLGQIILQWRESKLDELSETALHTLIMTPWQNRQQALQRTLDPWAEIERLQTSHSLCLPA
ncbi:MAG: hypothetical protein JSS53_02830, partial [Proteobacteria bacterium]|nr:hypothetical protein [Pseudomonadota bacterium]